MHFQTDSLTVESRNQQGQLFVLWRGRSDGRDPSRALEPVLEAVGADLRGAKSVEFDFRSMEYMNSSTIRPILQMVQRASTSVDHVRVVYDGSKNWQRLSFLAIGAVLATLGNVELCT